MGAAILMMKTQIGLGVLSIRLVFDTLGMIPGIIILLAIAIITTWVCGRNDSPAIVRRLSDFTSVWLHRWRLQDEPPRSVRH